MANSDLNTLGSALMNPQTLAAGARGFAMGGPAGAAAGVGMSLLSQANTNPALQRSLTNVALSMGANAPKNMLTNMNNQFMLNMTNTLGPMFQNAQNPQMQKQMQNGINKFLSTLEGLQPNAQMTQQQQTQQQQPGKQQQNLSSKFLGKLAGMTSIASEMAPRPGSGTGAVKEIEKVTNTFKNFMKSMMKPQGPTK